jgi:alpha-mannosidase
MKTPGYAMTILAAGFAVAVACGRGSAPSNQAKSNAPDATLGGLQSPWLQGWARTISGETMGYHSPYPDITTALLARATDGTMSIVWETAPIPADYKEDTATFVWMGGLATQKGAHKFALAVDDRPLLDFRTGRDASDKKWEISGPDGSSLRFETTFVDQFDELFGFMFLRLPRSRFTPGRPVRLSVTGEKGGSRDWCMVFPTALTEWIRADGEEALIRERGGAKQAVRFEISHFGPDAPAQITGPGFVQHPTIRMGYNRIQIPAAAVNDLTEIPIRIEIENREPVNLTVRLAPVARREIWLLPHSHNDIGYSDRQTVVEKNHWAYFEQAIEIARRSADYPPGARFKWNSEVLWAVDSYLRQASSEKKAAFFDAVKRGWIGLQALYANELTGIAPAEELYHFTDYARELVQSQNLKIDSAMITDIPSYSWNIVPVLAQSGVRYFSSGPNYMPTLIDGGDRIGGALKAWGDRPFYWVGPDGREKILFWMAGRGYSWFHGLNMGNLEADKSKPILDYCRELAKADYPYDMIQVRYTIGGDNGPPDPRLPDFVKAWNETYESPRFVIATASEMFAEFEKRFGDKLPSVRGDFTPHWEDGAASTAREQALNRAAANRLLQAEAIWSMTAPKKFPRKDFDEAWRYIILWDEHTWGAADSVSDPDGENARSQWAHKKGYVDEADRRSTDLMAKAAGAWSGGGGPPNTVDIVNGTGFFRTEVVLIPKSLSASGDAVQDRRGKPLPSQRLRTGELAVLAGPVPAFGAFRCQISAGPAAAPAGMKASAEPLENDDLKVRFDDKTGAIRSLRWKTRNDLELVDPADGRGLNEYLYVPGRDPKEARGVNAVTISVGEPGPLVASVVVLSDAPGARSLRREYVLTAGSGSLEIRDLIDKEKVRAKESVHIAFPFHIPGGQVRLDLGWGLIRSDVDQIAGANRDYFSVQGGVDISNRDFGLTWISPDAPLVEVGAITDETPREKGTRGWRTEAGTSQTLFAYVMNNYWHTNYKADQEGPVTFRFFVQPHAEYDSAETTRRGIAVSRPMMALPGAAAPLSGEPLLSFVPAGPWPRKIGPLGGIDPSGVVASSLRPSADGEALMIRLYNASGGPVDARVTGRLFGTRSIFRSSPFEDRGKILDGGRLRLLPFEVVTLRIEATKFP